MSHDAPRAAGNEQRLSTSNEDLAPGVRDGPSRNIVEEGEQNVLCCAAKRVRQANDISVAGICKEPASASVSRPTATELQEAITVIQQMKEMEPPLLSRRGAPPKPNVVACAIALQRGERFANDREALQLFGAHPETKVREVWVDGHLAKFAPAGIGTGDPALPVYLLERGEAGQARSGRDGGHNEWYDVPSYLCLEALRSKRQPDDVDSNDVNNEWACTCEHLNAMAKREREFHEWSAAHGAARDAQLADLTSDKDMNWLDFYWALAYSEHSRPRWQLRKGACIDEDAMETFGVSQLGVHEPLLRYRGFRRFTGDLREAEAAFSRAFTGACDHKWLDQERAKLEPGPTEATRPSAPRCIECGLRDCECPDPEDGYDSEAYGMDCYDDKPALEEERKLLPVSDCPDREYDQVMEERGRISRIHGKPWWQVPPGTTLSANWLDSTEDGGCIDRPWQRAEREQAKQEEREWRERMERMARDNIPPPYREDSRYGPRSNNQEGDDRFHKDREVWYEHVTGDSIEGLGLTEQCERVDSIARRFREYTDGRSERVASSDC